jgi:hypothetical protein
MLALISSIAAFAVGPLVHHWVHARPAPLAALEGFILTAIGGLVLFHILPHGWEMAGWPVVVAALVGALVPEVVERLFHHATARRVHLLVLGLALAGLLVHAALDGVALAGGAHGEFSSGVTLAVILHRIPVGLTIWWLLRQLHGPAAALGTLTLMAASTVVGYGIGPGLLGMLSGRGLGLFQALVGGALLHVVWHCPHGHAPAMADGHDHTDHTHPSRWSWPTALGGLLGLALVAALSWME